MVGRSKLFTAMILGALLALPGTAFAQSSTQGYNKPGGVVQDQINVQPARDDSSTPPADDDSVPPAATSTASPARSDKGGSLPFTGLDLAFVVGAGGVLLLLGFGIRRFTRTTDLA